MKDWPKTLKAFRKKYTFTQVELAHRLNTPCRTYQDWELGISKPPGCLKIALEYVKRDFS